LRKPIALLYQSWKLSRALVRIDVRRRLDLVQFTNFRSVGFFRGPRRPSVIRLSSLSHLLRQASSPAWDGTFQNRAIVPEDILEMLPLLRARAVFAPCRFIAEQAARWSRRTVTVIRSPRPRLQPDAWDRLPFCRFAEGRNYFLYFGSLFPIKGTVELAAVLGPFLREFTDLEFFLIGRDLGAGNGRSAESAMRSRLEGVENRCHFLPAMDRSRLMPFVQDARVCVFPSRIDNFPNTCVEAMSLGKVVVGTRQTGMDELIVHGESGLLCPPGDASALLQVMRRAASLNDAEREAISVAARKATEELSENIAYASHMRLYNAVLGRKQSMAG
jgi:glycosyltransferase involved in cell wall biosynthesis